MINIYMITGNSVEPSILVFLGSMLVCFSLVSNDISKFVSYDSTNSKTKTCGTLVGGGHMLDEFGSAILQAGRETESGSDTFFSAFLPRCDRKKISQYYRFIYFCGIYIL